MKAAEKLNLAFKYMFSTLHFVLVFTEYNMLGPAKTNYFASEIVTDYSQISLLLLEKFIVI